MYTIEASNILINIWKFCFIDISERSIPQLMVIIIII